jgi:hypothetical protein
MTMTMNLAQGVSSKKKTIPYFINHAADLIMEHLCVSFFLVLSNS